MWVWVRKLVIGSACVCLLKWVSEKGQDQEVESNEWRVCVSQKTITT
jgi:hypothetical protein